MIKSSHYQTPRTTAECNINPAYDPIEKIKHEYDMQDKIVMVGSVVALIAAAVILYIWK